ncbi:MAG TPA: M1 family peptidase, partial [Bacteroidia bacterium]|nr:M1 family peptidase [Bacteroidia bacterium]
MKLIAAILFLFITMGLHAQEPIFSRQDTLRGSITPEREWWDLVYYDLSVMVNTDDSTISGLNSIKYKAVKPGSVMQIDLQPPMQIETVVQNNKPLKYKREGNVYWITTDAQQERDKIHTITISFSGKPPVAINPPWDGGITWTHDSTGNWFIATSCQGIGASLWWPCKDHAYDEPDSMQISITVPQGLTAVSNGRLKKEYTSDSVTTFTWFVSNPINNYGVNMNIGKYAHFSEKYKGKKGLLNCDYYVLPYNLEKAKKQFEQVSLMFAAFEDRFGPYPFYEDGYKLVEVPYLGMEHQSSVTYGNGYTNG